jgi:hypothetical protein
MTPGKICGITAPPRIPVRACSRDKPGEWVLGVNIAGIGSYTMRKPGVSAGTLGALADKGAQVLCLATAMGLTEYGSLEIFLYLDAG